jgi:hypothetical protein
MRKKTKPQTPTQAQYARATNDVARTHAPTIYPCQKCGWPVAKGYICGYCGDGNPSVSRSGRHIDPEYA